MLANVGYDGAEVVATGEEAMQKAAETSPDLMLMDIVLKGERI